MEGLPVSLDGFRALVSQPLLLQAPLQGVLELLFNAIKAQEATIGELQAQAALLDRVAAAQDARSQGATEVLSQLEARLGAHQLAVAQEHQATGQRLRQLEQRLHGASNVAGRQAALDDIASMLGVAVPDLVVVQAQAGGHAEASPAAAPWPTPVPVVCGPVTAPAAVDSFAREASTIAGTSPAVGASTPAALGLAEPEADGVARLEAGAVAGPAEASKVEGSAPTEAEWQQEASGEVGVEPEVGVPVTAADSEGASSLGLSSPQCSPKQCIGLTGQPAAPATAPSGTWLKELHSQTGRTAPSTVAAADSSGQRQDTQPGGAAPVTGPAGTPAALPGSGSVCLLGTGSVASIQAAAAGQAAAAATPVAAEAAHQGHAAAAAPARSEVPSPAALFAAVQAGKAKAVASEEQPQSSGPPTASPAHTQRARPPQGRPRAASLPVLVAAAPLAAGAEEAAAPQDDTSQAEHGDFEQEGTGGSLGAEPLPGNGSVLITGRRKTEASRKLLEVVNLLRKRPSIQENGLLWKMQASLEETVAEQERLKGEVQSLQEQAAFGGGLKQCNQRVTAVEAAVVAVAGRLSGALPALPSPPVAPPAPVGAGIGDLKVLEDRVQALDCQVQEGAERLARLEAAQEAGAAAVTLARASSSGSAGDTLVALQGHLLAQQQKLQAQLEAVAAGIKRGLPGQVHDAVTGAVTEVGRRLSERLATKQDLQALSFKVTAKVSREEVERMLRAQRVPALPLVDPGAGPAAGLKFKCISCDSDLQPFLFAVAPGALPQTAGTADLRYTQLPAASPPRNPQQTWVSAVGAAGQPSFQGRPESAAQLSGGSSSGNLVSSGAHVQPPPPAQQALSPLTSRPSTGASRLGAPVGWMHRLRRDTGGGGSQDGAVAQAMAAAAAQTAGSRRESLGHPADMLQHQHSLISMPLQLHRLLTTAPLAQQSSGGPAPDAASVGPFLQLSRQGEAQQWEATGEEFYEAIREEPPATGTAEEEAVAAAEGSRALLVDSAARSGSKTALPALVQSPGRIKAARPATAALPVAGAAAGDWEPRSAASKRKTTGVAVGLG